MRYAICKRIYAKEYMQNTIFNINAIKIQYVCKRIYAEEYM